MMSVPLLDLMKDNCGWDRTFKRYGVNFPLRVQAVAEEEAFRQAGLVETLPGLACNIGLSGISFVCSGRFDLAELIEIEIVLEAQTYSLGARIRWCRELDLPDAALRCYGAQFLRTDAALRFIPVVAEFLLTEGREPITSDERSLAFGPAPREPQGTPT